VKTGAGGAFTDAYAFPGPGAWTVVAAFAGDPTSPAVESNTCSVPVTPG